MRHVSHVGCARSSVIAPAATPRATRLRASTATTPSATSDDSSFYGGQHLVEADVLDARRRASAPSLVVTRTRVVSRDRDVRLGPRTIARRERRAEETDGWCAHR